MIRDLRQFGDDRGYADLKGLEKLQAAALERLQQFEFNLRKKAEPNQARSRSQAPTKCRPVSAPPSRSIYRQLAKNKK